MLSRSWSDPKILQLQHRLGMPLPHVIGHLEAFFRGAYEHVPRSGRLSKRDMACVETWAMWSGDHWVFVKELVRSGVIMKNKRGFYLPAFNNSVPDFVRKRWLKNDLRKKDAPGIVRKKTEKSACKVRYSKVRYRTDKKGKDELCIHQDKVAGNGNPTPIPGATATGTPEAVASCQGQAVAPSVVKPKENGKDSSLSQPACLVLIERLRKALAEEPPDPPLMLLIAAGMDGAVARDLARKHAVERIRQAAVYASRNARANPAGLIRSALENPDWTLT